MITNIDSNINNARDNFIVLPVNCNEYGNNIFDEPHIEKEYIKYIKKHSKNRLDMLGKVQYIPIDSWAMPMVDTIKNNYVEAYDECYMYVSHAFVMETKYDILDLIAVYRCFLNIKSKAESINGTVAISKDFADNEDVYKIIEQVFKKSAVNVNIYN